MKVTTLITIVVFPIAIQPTFGQTTWTGATDNDWNTSGNWSSGVPNATPSGNNPTFITSDGATVNLSTAGASRGVFVTGDGTTAPVWNISADYSNPFSRISVGGYDGSGAAATGWSGTVNHTSGAVTANNGSGTERLEIVASNGGTGTGIYNFGGSSSTAPSLTLAENIHVANSSGSVGELNLSDHGTINAAILQVARANGTGTISVTGGNLVLNFSDDFLMSEFAAADSFLNATIDSTGFSTLNFTGNTAFGLGTSEFNLTVSGITPSVGTTYTIISSAGFIDLQSSGKTTFDNVADGDILSSNGVDFEANYTGGDFTVTVIPEPNHAALVLAAFGAALLLVRRKRG